jgi:CRP-like cAMP-binding protein
MERLLALQRVPLFAELSLDQIDAIAALVRTADLPAGEVVVREGDPGRELFVLLEGEVRVVRGLGTPHERELSRMRAITTFGEIAVLDGDPRSASIAALSDVRMLVLDGDRFQELVLQVPEIGLEVIRAVTKRLRVAEQKLVEERQAR